MNFVFVKSQVRKIECFCTTLTEKSSLEFLSFLAVFWYNLDSSLFKNTLIAFPGECFHNFTFGKLLIPTPGSKILKFNKDQDSAGSVLLEVLIWEEEVWECWGRDWRLLTEESGPHCPSSSSPYTILRHKPSPGEIRWNQEPRIRSFLWKDCEGARMMPSPSAKLFRIFLVLSNGEEY